MGVGKPASKPAKAPPQDAAPVASDLAAKAARFRRAMDELEAKKKRGTLPAKKANETKAKLLEAADALGIEIVRLGDSEWHAQMRKVVEKGSFHSVADKLDRVVSHTMLKKYLDKGSEPGPKVRAKVEKVYGISPELLYEVERPPPPPMPRAEVVKSMALDGTCHHFITNGPMPLVLTPAQSALVKVVFDLGHPRDLEGEERRCARLLFGDVEEIPENAREQAMLRLGRGSGKTTFCALYLAWRLNTCDLSEVLAHEEPAAVCFSNNSRTTKLVFNMTRRILGMMADVQDGIETDNEHEIKFNRPLDGRLVKLAAIVRSAGGLAGRGYWLIAVTIDEAEFMPSAKTDAVIQDEDQVDALTPRFLEGCQVMMISTPGWAMSYMAQTFDANWEKPTFAICAKGPTMLMRAGDAKMAKRRAKAWAKDKRKCAREFDVVPGASGGALIDLHLEGDRLLDDQRARTPPDQPEVAALRKRIRGEALTDEEQAMLDELSRQGARRIAEREAHSRYLVQIAPLVDGFERSVRRIDAENESARLAVEEKTDRWADDYSDLARRINEAAVAAELDELAKWSRGEESLLVPGTHDWMIVETTTYGWNGDAFDRGRSAAQCMQCGMLRVLSKSPKRITTGFFYCGHHLTPEAASEACQPGRRLARRPEAAPDRPIPSTTTETVTAQARGWPAEVDARFDARLAAAIDGCLVRVTLPDGTAGYVGAAAIAPDGTKVTV